MAALNGPDGGRAFGGERSVGEAVPNPGKPPAVVSGKAVEPWACPNCQAPVRSAYCPDCGEQPLRARHLTLHDLGHQLFVAFSKVDGKFLRTLRALILRPGELTLAFVQGRRAPYLGPLQIFLLANGLFFALHPISHASVFSSTLDSHLHHQDWSGLAQSMTAARLHARGLSLAAYAPVFDHAVVLNAKALVILMALVFALVLPVAFVRNRRPFAAHVVFALHAYGFLLLLLCLSLIVVAIDLRMGGPGLGSHALDVGLALLNLAVGGVYVYRAIGPVYGARGIARFVQAAALSAAIAAIVLGYRFSIFVITLYST